MKCHGRGFISEKRPARPVPRGGGGGGALALVVVAGLAYLGYRFGAETSNMPYSSRGTFFAMVGGYLAFLLVAWKASGIIMAVIVAGLAEFTSRIAFGFSLHEYILDAIQPTDKSL